MEKREKQGLKMVLSVDGIKKESNMCRNRLVLENVVR